MKKFIFPIVIPIGMLLNSCNVDSIDCIRASGTTKAKVVNLTGFTGVVFTQNGDVTIGQGPEYAISIQGPDNVLDHLTTELNGHDLVISSPSCFNGNDDLTVHITMPEIEKVNLVGVGNILSEGTWKCTNVDLVLTGAGKIKADVEADTINTAITGTGSADLSGKALKHQYINSGNAQLNAYDLLTNQTSIKVTGKGDSYVTANDKLKVEISGIGTVYYKGSPAIDSQITGTGEVVDKN